MQLVKKPGRVIKYLDTSRINKTTNYRSQNCFAVVPHHWSLQPEQAPLFYLKLQIVIPTAIYHLKTNKTKEAGMPKYMTKVTT